MASSARLDELKKKFEENPRRYFAPLANEHRKSGDLDQAITLCRTHLPQQPGHISGHIVLAQALFEAGSLDESREIFHSALGLDPENLIALRYLGDIAKESRDLDTARSWYQRVLEVDPRNDEIEQLIRDLDAPQPSGEAPSVQEVAAEASSFAPPAPAPSAPPPPAPAELDARFAPLSIDEVEIDDSFGAPSPAQPNDPSSAPQAAPHGEQASWSASESRGDAPALDAPDLDPFDLDPSGSVDALLDAPATPSGEDFFLTELSGAHATADGVEADVSHAESSSTPEAPAEPAIANAATEHLATLDDAAFHLEPPPDEPAAPVEHDAVPDVAPELTAAAPESKDQITIPGMDAFAAEYSTGSYGVIPEPEPNEDAIEHLASLPTAEWQPPAPPVQSAPAAPSAPAPIDDGLGLEVMEFVPPSSQAAAPAAYPEVPDADPVLGRTLAMSTNEPSQTPAAFVTETMAELYLQQGFRNEALAVYRELLAKNPSDNNLRDRVEQIESGAISSIGMASVSGDVVESALKRQSGRPPRSVRSFFASLAGRRAPAPREPAYSESDSDAERPTPDEPAEQLEAASSADHTGPATSAAETLATFDPFADTADSEHVSASALDAAATPNEPLAEFSTGLTSRSRQTPRSTPAQTPASALGHAEPQGRPTRAASNELSLDHVFRGAPEPAPAADGGFSFDQFFSDSQASNDDAAAAAAAPESGRGGGSGDAHDIEQFTAWLEGLKKK